MKKVLFKMLFLLAMVSLMSSCSKDDGYVENPDEKDLTVCPPNSDCEFWYADKADVEGNSFEIKNGPYRVFWSRIGTSGISVAVYIKAPATGTTFSLGAKDIAAGRIKILPICPACFSIPLKIAGGSSKGVQLNSFDAKGKHKWLLETKLFIQAADANANYADTVFVKQYYYSSLIINQ